MDSSRVVPKFTVQSVGALVSDRFVGIVRSIHSRVVNIEVRSEDLHGTIKRPSERDSRLCACPLFVSLVTSAGDMTDLAVLIPDMRFIRYLESSRDAPVVRDGNGSGEIRIGDRDRGLDLSVTGAAIWSGTGRRGSEDGIVRAERLNRFCQFFQRTGTRLNGFAPLVGKPETPGARRDPFLKRASEILTGPDGGFAGLARLAGLGIGFTPAGDDFLAGVFLAFSEAGIDPPGDLQKSVADALPRTTTGGATLLYLVLQGRFPAYQLSFLDNVTSGMDPERVMQELRRHGQTSGTDMAAGFCWAIGFMQSAAATSPDAAG